MTVRFVTRRLSEFSDQAADLNDLAGSGGLLFVRNGVGYAGIGEITRVPLEEAVSYLQEVKHDSVDEVPSDSVLAFGWHPFSGHGGTAIVPAVCFSKSATGDTWVTFHQDQEQSMLEHLKARHDQPALPSTYGIRPGVSVERYLSAVTHARDAVRRGEITKAVIARDIFVDSSSAIDVHALLRRLKVSFGSSYRFSIDGFVGASPELLLERDGDVIRSQPLAGTCPRTGDPTTDARLASELRSSRKNQIEHRVVIDMVHDTLLPYCSYLDWQPEPEVIAVANVQHLGTTIEGRLSEPLTSVIDLVKELSPTPALGGYPRDAALQLIAEHEGLDRGRYGGAVGWVDRNGNGTWAVAIRCAELSADRTVAHLFAGGGIVADSEPLAELAETQAKFQAMLAAIIRP
jgi:menaquinone-specific isochorismate synthase